VSASTPSVLARILQTTREELDRRKREVPLEQLRRRVAGESDAGGAAVDRNRPAAAADRDREAAPGQTSSRGFRAALARPGISVIAEFKRRSPSAGALREGADLAELVRAYARGGASALSVLTEQPNFAGSLDDLSAARRLCALPLLRKDFIVDEYQLFEARAAGADAVLLIVAALSETELALLHSAARALALDVLVEVHDRDELDRALAVGADLVGVNNRDLRDFSVDTDRTVQLRGAIPAGVVVVSESGIGSSSQVRELEREGIDAVLVGESLMRAHEPERALRALLGDAVAGGTGAT
jgi:indole-3-glycerol phosphate synthase